jgi:putative flippase GtrA
MEWTQRIPWRALGRWWAVGLVFTVAGTGAMYVAKDVVHLPLFAATLISSELLMLVRFVVNDRWVFGNARPTWRRLWQFHVASAGGAAVWLIVANGLPRFGVHYLIASLIGTACSVCLSMVSNFLWVWREGKAPATAAKAVAEEGS